MYNIYMYIHTLGARSLQKESHARTRQQNAVSHGIPWISGKHQPPSVRYTYIYIYIQLYIYTTIYIYIQLYMCVCVCAYMYVYDTNNVCLQNISHWPCFL